MKFTDFKRVRHKGESSREVTGEDLKKMLLNNKKYKKADSKN